MGYKCGKKNDKQNRRNPPNKYKGFADLNRNTPTNKPEDTWTNKTLKEIDRSLRYMFSEESRINKQHAALQKQAACSSAPKIR